MQYYELEICEVVYNLLHPNPAIQDKFIASSKFHMFSQMNLELDISTEPESEPEPYWWIFYQNQIKVQELLILAAMINLSRMWTTTPLDYI